jgi:hypothetical protein
MRANFLYHAAHFIGNCVFGISVSSTVCFLWASDIAEERKFADDSTRIPLRDHRIRVLLSDDASLREVQGLGGWPSLEDRAEDADDPKRIVHIFASWIGFWSTAMLERIGAFVNGIDSVCINLRKPNRAACGTPTPVLPRRDAVALPDEQRERCMTQLLATSRGRQLQTPETITDVVYVT